MSGSQTTLDSQRCSMRKDAQEFEGCMKQLKKTIEQQRREHGDSEDARLAEVFMKRLTKKVNQSRQENEKATENEKAMGSSDTGVYVDMALGHERKLKKTRAKRRVSKRADAEARRARPSKTPMNAYKVGTKFGRKKPKMKRKIIEL